MYQKQLSYSSFKGPFKIKCQSYSFENANFSNEIELGISR